MFYGLQMKEFYHAQYSSNIMCLTVYGTQSLDDLETMVKDKFDAVPNSNLQPAPISGRCSHGQSCDTMAQSAVSFDSIRC